MCRYWAEPNSADFRRWPERVSLEQWGCLLPSQLQLQCAVLMVRACWSDAACRSGSKPVGLVYRRTQGPAMVMKPSALPNGKHKCMWLEHGKYRTQTGVTHRNISSKFKQQLRLTIITRSAMNWFGNSIHPLWTWLNTTEFNLYSHWVKGNRKSSNSKCHGIWNSRRHLSTVSKNMSETGLNVQGAQENHKNSVIGFKIREKLPSRSLL
jgi:hypothetical protein